MRFPFSTILVLCLCWDAPCAAQVLPFEVEVRDVAGKTHVGQCRELTHTGVVLQSRLGKETLAAGDVVLLRVQRSAAVKPHLGSQILLANGDRLMASWIAMDETHATASWNTKANRSTFRIPLETIRSAIFRLPVIREKRDRVVRELLTLRPKSDTVLLTSGDRIAGQLTALSKDEMKVETSVGEVATGVNAIRAVALNDELVSMPAGRGLRTLVSFVDGTWLTTSQPPVWDGGETLTLRTAWGAELVFAIADVAELRYLGGRAVHLGELRPAKVSMTPFLTTQWPLRTNLNVLGSALNQSGREFPRGLGMHSRCAVTYELKGGYESFLARVGIDAAAERQGSVVFSVTVDGQERFRKLVSGRDGDIPIDPVDVRGAKSLTLTADFGDFADIRDYANWYDAVLVKAAKP